MKKTTLHQKHVEAGARMIDFGGWDMPVTYSDIAGEHLAVRRSAGLFDLGHMGRVAISGPDARELVQKSQSNDLDRIPAGQIRYALILADDGGVIDDILVHNRGRDIYLVVNASNREVVVERLRELAAGLDVTIDDESERVGMIAVQGPRSPEIVQQLTDIDLADLGYYRLAEGEIDGTAGMITRTGYTGEDGFELYLPAEKAPALWDRVLELGGDLVRPCGLGARDTLRLEAGMPLYGHEMDRGVNPVEANLMFGVRLKKADYPGRAVLERVKAEGPARRMTGFVVEGRRIPRQGYDVVKNGEVVGRVCSGTWSPSFEQGIATALVASEALADDDGFEIDIRGKRAPARIVALPFYKRDGSGSLNV